MNNIIRPVFENYTLSEVEVKFIGGRVMFYVNRYGRFIDFTNVSMSTWVSDMKLVATPTTFKITANGYINLWSRTVDGERINGTTLPRVVYDIGADIFVNYISIEAINQENPDNHEFILWSDGLDPYITVTTAS